LSVVAHQKLIAADDVIDKVSTESRVLELGYSVFETPFLLVECVWDVGPNASCSRFELVLSQDCFQNRQAIKRVELIIEEGGEGTNVGSNDIESGFRDSATHIF
jgi:hypothetical protein